MRVFEDIFRTGNCRDFGCSFMGWKFRQDSRCFYVCRDVNSFGRIFGYRDDLFKYLELSNYGIKS